MRLGTPFVFAALAAGSVLYARDASACGGCYHRAAETETTVVTGHRMAVSVSSTQTVLWDQIEYAGSPSEFAWVLPVRPGARIDLATDAWFETLDAGTSVRVVGPRLDCIAPPSGDRGGFGCGSQDEAADLGGGNGQGAPPGETVTVVHQGTVGPYETVTLSTDQPGALDDWLSKNGYAVDDGVQPIIDAYVAEGFDFIALRLKPGANVRQMKPVRVVSPGASPALPLRMVAAGTGANVAITLFVIGEGRWEADNFPNGRVAADSLTWDYLTSDSNYAELRRDTLSAGDGRTWLTTFAHPRALLEPVESPIAASSFGYGAGGNLVTTIAEAYLVQAAQNGETGGETCDLSFLDHSTSTASVVDPCPPEPRGTDCPAVGPSEIDARAFACGAADDLAVALTGMHPGDVWLVRLEANLPRAALGTDLGLRASSDQTPVDNWLAPNEVLHAQDVCRANGLPAAALLPWGGPAGRPPRAFLVVSALAALACAAVLRRARATRGSHVDPRHAG